MSNPPNTSDNTRLLGEIHGMVQSMRDTQKQHTGKFERLEDRLRNQEQKAAVSGAYTGGAVAVGIALIIEGAKQWLTNGRGGSA